MTYTRFPLAKSAILVATGVLLGALPALAGDGQAARSRTSGASEPASTVERSTSDSSRTARPRTGAEAARSPERARTDRRDHRRDVHFSHSFSRWGWHGYPSFWWGGWGWWGFGPSVVVVHDRGYARGGGGYGALDLDVHPEEAEVWVDGQRMGIADNFDGFPDLLWLPDGEHEVIVFHPGYRTIHRIYDVYDGTIIEVGDRMERGESVDPQAILDRATPRRDARIERNRSKRERADRYRREEGWRSREGEAYRDVPPPQDDWRSRSQQAPAAPAPSEAIAGSEDALVGFRVVPADASVYLDGEFLGLAGELGELSLAPGPHRVDVVRPGYEGFTEELDLEPGERRELEIRLEDD